MTVLLKQKTLALMRLRAKKNKLEEKYRASVDPIKKEIDALSLEMMAELKESGQFAARFSFATLSMAVRKTPKVVDEEKVIVYLREKGLAN